MGTRTIEIKVLYEPTRDSPSLTEINDSESKLAQKSFFSDFIPSPLPEEGVYNLDTLTHRITPKT